MRALSMPLASRLAAIVFVGFLAGCGDDNPTKPTPPAPIMYPILSSPANVLLALETAYSKRDSTEYKRLYDSTYVGRSESYLDTFVLNFSDEARHIAALARTRTIIGDIFCDFGPEASWTRLPSSDLTHPEWASIQLSGSTIYLRIDDGSITYDVHGSNETMSFHFSPSAPDSSSPTDTLWKIVRWNEIQY